MEYKSPKRRGSMQDMARARRNPTIPSLRKTQDVVKSFRIPVELAERLEEARGLIPESVWIRKFLEQTLTDRTTKDLEQIRDLMYERGITIKKLAEFMGEHE